MGQLVGPGQYTPYEGAIQPLSLFQKRLPTDNNQLHFLVPAGVGDCLWIVSKLWQVCMERDVTFWLPGAEQKRSGDLFRMMGLKYGYMPDLTTEWIWSRPGSPPIPDTGAVLSIQPNRHLEHGHRIERWYPEYEYRNPCEFMDLQARIFKQEAVGQQYVIGFMSQTQYMEYGGNLKPAQWARIWRMVEENVGPVALIAAGKDVQFLDEVMKFFEPSLNPIIDASLDQVAQAMAGANMVLGAHAGPLILSTYMGIPTLQGMPRWLAPMAGTWEMEGATWGACFLDELENVVREGIKFDGNASMGRMREAALPKITMHTDVHPRWRQSDVRLHSEAESVPEVPVPVRDAQSGNGLSSVFNNGGHVTEQEIREGMSSG